MGAYEYKTHIRYTDINENNELSDKGILNILSEAARSSFRYSTDIA